MSISQKQKELTKLQKQILALQQELQYLENENPAYKKRCDELTNERAKLLASINEVRQLRVNSFIDLNYKWNGIGQMPKITSHKFLLDSKVNIFLEETIVRYNILDTIFDSNISDVRAACKILDDLDKKIIKFNTKVNSSYKQFKEEYLKTLIISNEVH